MTCRPGTTSTQKCPLPILDVLRAELFQLPADAICGSYLQELVIQGERVSLSKLVYRGGGVTCRDTGTDEKDFWAFAHDK